MTFKEIVLMSIDVDGDGLVRFSSLAEYAKAFGTDEDKADEIMDDVLEELVDDGTFTEMLGDYYMTEVLDEIADAEDEAIAEMTAYHADIEASWNAAKGIR